jgi:Tautomerase enzyme
MPLVAVDLRGRPIEAKRASYRAAAAPAERAGVRPPDVTIVLVENEREDRSVGLCQASHLELPPERWR